jgi:benzil reductase ((S)-benzoin forming)
MKAMDPHPIEQLFLITGTTRGIGKALVAAALELPGSFVVSLSRATPFLWPNHQNICIDLNHTDRIGQAFAKIHFDFKNLTQLKRTVLINNAGVLDPIAPIGDCTDDLLAQNMRVNLIAPLILTRHFFHYSRHFQGSKWIVNITSGASQVPYYGWSAYGAAKAGLDMATRSMALEFAQQDPAFHICAVAPGTVDTDMQTRIRKCSADQFARVEKFVELKSSGSLWAPARVATRLIRMLMENNFENGGRYDLRELGA